MLLLSVGLQLVRPESIPWNHKFDYNFAYSNSEQIDSIFIFFSFIIIIHLFFLFYYSSFFLFYYSSFFLFSYSSFSLFSFFSLFIHIFSFFSFFKFHKTKNIYITINYKHYS